jgi:hypothetical protein
MCLKHITAETVILMEIGVGPLVLKAVGVVIMMVIRVVRIHSKMTVNLSTYRAMISLFKI